MIECMRRWSNTSRARASLSICHRESGMLSTWHESALLYSNRNTRFVLPPMRKADRLPTANIRIVTMGSPGFAYGRRVFVLISRGSCANRVIIAQKIGRKAAPLGKARPVW